MTLQVIHHLVQLAFEHGIHLLGRFLLNLCGLLQLLGFRLLLFGEVVQSINEFGNDRCF